MNEKRAEENQIYDKQTQTWFSVSPTDYHEYRRWCTSVRKREQRQNTCYCPREKWWLCDAMCDDCEFHSKSKLLSVNATVRDRSGNEVLLLEALAGAEENPCEIILSRIQAELFLKRLHSLMPEALEIGKMRLLGLKDDAIAEALGLNRMAFRARIEAARKRLVEEYGDDFFDF